MLLLFCSVKKAVIIVLSLFFSVAVLANNEPSSTRIISGKIIDQQTGETLAGVKVQVKSSDTFCYTDMNGNYVLALDPKANPEISIEMVGYKPLDLKSSETGLEKELYLSPL